VLARKRRPDIIIAGRRKIQNGNSNDSKGTHQIFIPDEALALKMKTLLKDTIPTRE
jgi:hypothetical protein